MPESNSMERRRDLRVQIALAVELKDARGFSLHSSRDISVGGAFFDRAIPHAVGSKVQVSFTLPGDTTPIVCDGEVVNVPDAHSFGMGVRFANMRDEDTSRLDAFV